MALPAVLHGPDGAELKDIISEQKFVIEQLDNYIAGHR
jgi:hypothetical protein